MYEESHTLKRSVVPAVIPTSKRHLDTTLEKCADFAEEVQVDIVDGVFTPQQSWPYTTTCAPETILATQKFQTIPVELDLMIQNPEETLDLWIQTGAKKIVIHVESTQKLNAIIEESATKAFHLGISLNNNTDLSALDAIDMDAVDYIQLMGIAEIGAQGQPFDTRVLKRIQEVRTKYPRLPISIDGSVNQDTIARLVAAGANRFVAGSAILGTTDWVTAYTTLSKKAEGNIL